MSERPSVKPTATLPKVSAVDIKIAELSVLVRDGFAAVRADIAIVSSEVGVTKERVTLLEKRMTDLESRAANHSERVRGASAIDLEHDAKIAEEMHKREALAREVAEIRAVVDKTAKETTNQTATLAAQTEILEKLERVASNPIVKAVVAIVGTAVLSWLASRGFPVK